MKTHEKEVLRSEIAAEIQRRLAAGETREQIAQDIGVHPVTVWKWAQGREIRDSSLSLISLLSRRSQAA